MWIGFQYRLDKIILILTFINWKTKKNVDLQTLSVRSVLDYVNYLVTTGDLNQYIQINKII